MLLLVAPLAALTLTLAAGWWLIPILRRLKAGQTIRSEGPQTHLGKSGTPTMGGLVFALPAAAVGLALVPPGGDGWIAALTLIGIALGSGAIGFTDDYFKVVLRRPLGLRAREKLFWQTFLGLGLAYVADQVLDLGTGVVVPFFGWQWELGAWYYPFVLILVMATGNALNLTDGLDGLLAGAAAVSFGLYAAICLQQGRVQLAIVTLGLMASCLGFLAYNRYPARVFMGDSGSFFLGGALAALAVLTKTELLLPVAGGLYALETLSVILQVLSFHLLGRRIFRMSPLHHHFELAGWSETTVVGRFWLVNAAFAALAWLGYAPWR